MKRIYLIGGTMGVGKTSVCQPLKKRLKNAVFLDGDWCWDVISLFLICSRDELAKRLKKDMNAGIRQENVIARSIERLPLYAALNTMKVDVSDLSVDQTAEIIASF